MNLNRVLNVVAFVILGLSLVATIIATTTQGWIVGEVTVNEETLSFQASLLHIYINNNVSEVEEVLNAWFQEFPDGADFSGIKTGADGGMAFMIFALGSTLISGTIFTIALCQESAILGTSAAHCMTFAALFVVIAIAFISHAVGTFTLSKTISYGYSYGVAWFAMSLDVLSGIVLAIIGHRMKKR